MYDVLMRCLCTCNIAFLLVSSFWTVTVEPGMQSPKPERLGQQGGSLYHLQFAPLSVNNGGQYFYLDSTWSSFQAEVASR
jgi:hypothetical protein